MSEAKTEETPEREDAQHDSRAGAGVVARCALLVADDGAELDALREKLASAGFEVTHASAQEAASRARESTPSVVLLAFGSREVEGHLLALTRRLRTEPASFSLPVVFLFRDDWRTLRSAAQHFGADDYFAQNVPAEELRARLEALLWRAESGRRFAPAIADQRSEIDNFLFLLDAVGADARSGATGALALVEASRPRGDIGGRDGIGDSVSSPRPHVLADAHGFLKLNLRRVDAVAFYGPATLLVYLPGAGSHSARATLSRLREEFSEAGTDGDLHIGISSFPAQGSEVERLVEQAEAALAEARGENSATRVIVYGVEDSRHAPDSERRTASGARGMKTRTVVNEPGAAAGEPTAASMNESASRLAALTQTGERRTGGRLRRVMLVVSDAARMAQVNLLLRSAAYEVRAAFDGTHALNLLRIDRPDALVVDYELQEMDGAEMLKRLAKQSRPGRTPPALLLVPAGREDLRGEALRAGARVVIDMPYDAVELLDTLREFCETQ
jgi:PleD family two-component response regulator